MSPAGISIESIFLEHKELEIDLIAGKSGLSSRVMNSEINRPGLSLTGFFDHFAFDRIQVFGKGEWAYMESLNHKDLEEITSQFFSYPLLCIVFTHNNYPTRHFVEKSESANIPIFVSSLSTHKFITIISQILDRALAPRAMRHGVLIEVFGIGTLLTGKSGVGKSETALELIERGHRLVADDMVEIKRYSESYIVGTCSDILRHHMEIRGLGIINIKDIFGIGAVRDHKLIELVINLEAWKEGMEMDRTGLEEQNDEILGIKIPIINIPVRPGRNIPILVETAAMNQRLKKMGKFGAQEFNKKLTQYIDQHRIERAEIKN